MSTPESGWTPLDSTGLRGGRVKYYFNHSFVVNISNYNLSVDVWIDV